VVRDDDKYVELLKVARGRQKPFAPIECEVVQRGLRVILGSTAFEAVK
jgi:hypothetical protein